MIAQGLPSIKNVLEALLYCLFIFVMGLILLPNGVKLLGFYFKILLWLQLWAPLFAMLNFIMTEALSWRTMSAMKGDGGITIGNFVGLSNMAMDMSAIAGYLCSVIPILAWTLLDRGGYAFVSMASSLMGVAQGAATQAATEKATGNYSFGNMSFENRNMNNMSHLKQDNAPSYSGYGHMTSNEGSYSILTDADGKEILTQNESRGPVSLNIADSKEAMLRSHQNEAQTSAEGQQKSGMEARQQANNHSLEFGKNSQNMIALGKNFQDQETYNHAQESAEHYSRVQQISDKTGLGEEIVNQLAWESYAGVSSPSIIVADIGTKISKSENSQMTASATYDSILELGKTTNYNEQHQKMEAFHKNKNVDLQDQELKTAANNYSSNYDESLRLEKSAHASFEYAKSFNKEIGYTQSSSASVNASFNQEHADYVGAHKLKNMPVEEQQRSAQQFMAKQLIQKQELHQKTMNDLKDPKIKEAYNNSQADQAYGGQTVMQQKHGEFEDKVNAEKPQVNQAEKNRVIENVDSQIQKGNLKMFDEGNKAKLQQVEAHQKFDQKAAHHDGHKMGFTQGSDASELHQKHKGKNGG